MRQILCFFSLVSSLNLALANPCHVAIVDNAVISAADVTSRVDSHLFSDAITELGRLVAIPSISSKNERNEPALAQAVAQVARLAGESGLENVVVHSNGDDAPILTAEWLHAPGQPTVLLYAHYDVFSPGQISAWHSDPFTMVQRNGRFFGRGVADDKGGLISLFTALKAFKQSRGGYPVNVKVVIEGGEEIGADLSPFVLAHESLFKADVLFICDGQNHTDQIPSLTTSLRGRLLFDIRVTSTNSPQHSGLFGGVLPSPVKELARIIRSATDEEDQIVVPEVMANVVLPSNVAPDHSAQFYLDSAGARPNLRLVASEDFSMRIAHLPSLNWTNILSNADNPGAIPSEAWTTFAVRTVPTMNVDQVEIGLRNYFAREIRYGMDIKLIADRSKVVDWWVSRPQLPAIELARLSLSRAFLQPSVEVGMGGFLPFVSLLENRLGVESTIFTAVGDPLTNMHGINESVARETILKAIRANIYILESLSKPGALGN